MKKNSNIKMFTDPKKVIVSINDFNLVSDSCFLEVMTTNHCFDNDTMEIELRFITTDWNISNEILDFDNKKVRNKKVSDCSIQELLFAIREKSKGIKNERTN